MRQGVPTIINPYDLFALEEAMRLRDEFGGRVTVLCMGPPMAEDALRRALGLGADRAVLITDRRFAGSDTLATSFALATTLETLGKDKPVREALPGHLYGLTEGVVTADSIYEISIKQGISMPICTTVYHVLKGHMTVQEGINDLLGRPFAAEGEIRRRA